MSKFTQDIILTPVVTERSMDIMRSQRKYTFKVAKDANKIEIKEAVEKMFPGTKVKSVNTMNMQRQGTQKRLHLRQDRRLQKSDRHAHRRFEDDSVLRQLDVIRRKTDAS